MTKIEIPGEVIWAALREDFEIFKEMARKCGDYKKGKAAFEWMLKYYPEPES